jgi:hypothetical protein
LRQMPAGGGVRSVRVVSNRWRLPIGEVNE